MKALFKLIVLTAFILAAIAAIGVWFYKSDTRKSFDFATDAANDISVSWDVKELQRRAHPIMIKNITSSGHQMADYFAVLSRIGVLKTIMNCTLVHSAITIFPSFNFNTDYICHGEYEHGDATLTIGLVQEKPIGPWQIGNFSVDSPIFAPPAANQQSPGND